MTPGEAAVDPPAEVEERRGYDCDREDVLHRRRLTFLRRPAPALRHEAGVDQPHDDDGPVVELLGQDLAVERDPALNSCRVGSCPRRGLNTIARTPLMDVPPLPADDANSKGEATKRLVETQWRVATPFERASCRYRTPSGRVLHLGDPPTHGVDHDHGDARVASRRLAAVERRHPVAARWDASSQVADLVSGGLKSTSVRPIARASSLPIFFLRARRSAGARRGQRGRRP